MKYVTATYMFIPVWYAIWLPKAQAQFRVSKDFNTFFEGDY